MKENNIAVFDMVSSISRALDMINKSLVGHHRQVAYISLRLAKELNFSQERLYNLVIAANLHDIGAFSLQERLELLNFEAESNNQHSEIGYRLLKKFSPFSNLASIVRYHHLNWEYGEGKEFKKKEVPLESHILHLADRIAILVNGDKMVLNQTNKIRERIKDYKGEVFNPGLVEVFLDLAVKEEFWLSIASSEIMERALREEIKEQSINLNLEEMLGLSWFFSQIIDFRSSFTATHSQGIAASAEAMARLIGWSEGEAKKIKIAGYLHDLGKLAIPSEILDKPGKLSKKEFNIIRSHTFYTYHVLDLIDGIEEIKKWAAFHHERLDGTGYPFHYDRQDLSTGARIMAIADVFTALTEDRPYRKGMKKEKVIKILKSMADSQLDSDLVSLLIDNYEELNQARQTAQNKTVRYYDRLGL